MTCPNSFHLSRSQAINVQTALATMIVEQQRVIAQIGASSYDPHNPLAEGAARSLHSEIQSYNDSVSAFITISEAFELDPGELDYVFDPTSLVVEKHMQAKQDAESDDGWPVAAR